jgi:hypothetical protein
VTELHHDIDDSDAIQTVRVALDGVEYEIDLSDRNADRLRNSLAEFERACSQGQESAWTHARLA